GFWKHDSLSALQIILPAQQVGGTLVVNTTEDIDDGTCTESHCSLREAINQANGDGIATTINFSIDNTVFGDAPHVITVASALPAISAPVTIDGLSEPDVAAGNCPFPSGE